jgi:hypothetical protein
MDLETRIAALIELRGGVVTPAVTRAIDELLAVVEDQQDTRGRILDDEEGGGADEDGVTATRYIDCPHCGERLPIALDVSAGGQDDIQDCEVCCRPIRIVYTVEDGQISGFSAQPV